MNTLTQNLVSDSGSVENHQNREGAPSFRRSIQEQVLAILSTGTLSGTFYASRQELAQEALGVFIQARQVCPEFLARALVWAREQGMMKTLPVTGLVVLSAGGGRTKDLFERAFVRVVKTPDDLRAFVSLAKSGAIPGRRGLGGLTVAPVRDFCANFSEYHALKYGSANSETLTLRDIVRLSHPRPTTPTAAERLAWLSRGKKGLGEDASLNSRIRAFEALKRVTDEAEILQLIRAGGLPYEVVIPSLKRTTPAIWSELLKQAPYFNLLRNLLTFSRHQVFRQEENVAYAVARLTDPEAIRRSRVLPFRFFTAWAKARLDQGFDRRLTDALREALNLSFANLPSLGARTVAIGTDVSGSMGGLASDKSVARYIDIAGIYTGALLKRSEGRTVVLPFDTRVHTGHDLSGRDDIIVTTEKLARYHGGGTAVGSPIEHLLGRKIKVDVFIGITDGEDWAYGGYGDYCSGSFLDRWRCYREKIAPEAQAFLINIAPYRDAVAPSGAGGVHFISGWSDQVLNFIASRLDTGESQVKLVEQLEL